MCCFNHRIGHKIIAIPFLWPSCNIHLSPAWTGKCGTRVWNRSRRLWWLGGRGCCWSLQLPAKEKNTWGGISLNGSCSWRSWNKAVEKASIVGFSWPAILILSRHSFSPISEVNLPRFQLHSAWELGLSSLTDKYTQMPWTWAWDLAIMGCCCIVCK